MTNFDVNTLFKVWNDSQTQHAHLIDEPTTAYAVGMRFVCEAAGIKTPDAWLFYKELCENRLSLTGLALHWLHDINQYSSLRADDITDLYLRKGLAGLYKRADHCELLAELDKLAACILASTQGRQERAAMSVTNGYPRHSAALAKDARELRRRADLFSQVEKHCARLT